MSKKNKKKAIVKEAPPMTGATKEALRELPKSFDAVVEEAKKEEPKPADPPQQPETDKKEEVVTDEMEVDPNNLTEAQKRRLQTLVGQQFDKNNAKLRRSTIDGPVKIVAQVCEAMYKLNPDVKRSEIIKFCEENGVATNTAKTQTQIWFAAKKRDLEAAKLTAMAS